MRRMNRALEEYNSVFDSLHEFCVLLVCLGQRPAKKRLLGRKNGGRQAASTITIYLAAYSFARRYHFPGTF